MKAPEPANAVAWLFSLEGADTYIALTVAGSIAMAMVVFRQQQARAAERLRRWHEEGSLSDMPFSARVAERLREMDRSQG